MRVAGAGSSASVLDVKKDMRRLGRLCGRQGVKISCTQPCVACSTGVKNLKRKEPDWMSKFGTLVNLGNSK